MEEAGIGSPKHYSLDERHAAFATSVTGTSPIEILHVLFSISITPLLVSLLTPWVVPAKFVPMAFGDKGSRDFVRALIEYPVVGILPLLIITVFAGHSDENEEGFYQQLSYCIPTVLVLSCLGILIVNHSITKPTWASLVTQWKRVQDKIISSSFATDPKDQKKAPRTLQIPFFTTYRSIVIYVTVLSILAVDFKIFPRRFCKTKTFGFSLMDIGTGSFIFANGIVSSEARRMSSNFRQVILSSIPLFVLGFVRLFSIKGVEYHEVVEEYGVHWNFFFTLGVVKWFSAILFLLIHPKHSLKLGFLIGLSYEGVLVFTGFQNEYLLNPSVPRSESLIDANREGIFSTIGYTSIYLMSIYCGQVIYQSKTPLVRFRDWMRYGLVSGLQICFLWFLTYLSHSYCNPSSRRAGNFSYVLWSVSTNYTILWLHLTFFLIQHVLQNTGLVYGPLLFHQLESSYRGIKTRRIREEIAKSRILEEAKWRVERDEQLNAPTELELSRLEGKLGLVEEKLKARSNNLDAGDGPGPDEDDDPFSQKELEELTTEMEQELKSVGKKCFQASSLLDIVKKSGETETNLAFLPDLTLAPIISEAICYNGLAIFLLGNLLTGGINSLIVSMYTPNGVALVILWAYATLIICISVILYFYKIQLKFW